MVASLRGISARGVTLGLNAGPPPPYPPGTFVYDSFTGTNGTPIVSHVGETGVTWTEASGETHMIAANYLMGIQRSGSDTRLIPSAGVTGSWYFETEIYVNEVNSNDRIQGYQNSDLSFLFYVDATTIFTNTNSITPSFSAGNSYIVRFEFSGTQVELFIDGISQYVDTTVGFLPTGIISFDLFNSLLDLCSKLYRLVIQL